MKIYDISMNIHPNMTVYKNRSENKPLFNNQSNYDTANNYETSIEVNLHTGTHIDAPLHMFKGGGTLETYSLSNFITKSQVIDLTNINDKITKDDLINRNINPHEFIIFKTKNSYDDDFNYNFIYVDESAAKYLAEKEIIGVGIDALSIERNQNDHITHKILLNKKIAILEGLRLKDICEGYYTLIALPLKLDNVEASLVRAVLIDKAIY